jgi:hypothetical protein
MKLNPIYVETFINCRLDDLWEYTQMPEKHQQWDLRFSEIKYLPKENESSPQKFLYLTKIGFGLKISGEGESSGTNNKADGESTSALKFWSDEPISLIRTGSGYWKYIPEANGVKFLTWYDYKTRFALSGSLLDKFVFRPLIGWATAWSFDCLRLWLEKGITPETSIKNSIVQNTARYFLAFIWIYQGLIPKLLFKDSGELEILRATGIFSGYEEIILTIIGIAEIIFGLAFLFTPPNKIIYHLNNLALVFLGLGAIFSQPKIFTDPFNPATLTLAMIGLAIAGLCTLNNLPSAGNCLRKPQK